MPAITPVRSLNSGAPVRLAFRVVLGGLLAAVVAAGGVCGLPTSAAPPRSPGAPVTFFGLESRGSRIVYVCDRSASMGEPDGRPLAAAKAELIRSLYGLGASQQFGLLFYNERPRVFAAGGGAVRPVFAAEESRQQARAFIEAVQPAGGTRHAEAIAAALKMGADAVFVLTDADADHDLTGAELRSLSRAAAGTRIMVVQFGDAADRRSPRLAELAEGTGGTYAVVEPTVAGGGP